MTDMEALEAVLKTLMEETQVETVRRLATSLIISRGPNNGIAGADMCIISRETLETQGMLSDRINNDTQLNGSGVTNLYAFYSVMDRLARTPDQRPAQLKYLRSGLQGTRVSDWFILTPS